MNSVTAPRQEHPSYLVDGQTAPPENNKAIQAFVEAVLNYKLSCSQLGYQYVEAPLLPIANHNVLGKLSLEGQSQFNHSLALSIQGALAKAGLAHSHVIPLKEKKPMGQRYAIRIKLPDVDDEKMRAAAEKAADLIWARVIDRAKDQPKEYAVKLSTPTPEGENLLKSAELLAAYNLENQVGKRSEISTRLRVDSSAMRAIMADKVRKKASDHFAHKLSCAWRVTSEAIELRSYEKAPGSFKRWLLGLSGWTVGRKTEQKPKATGTEGEKKSCLKCC